MPGLFQNLEKKKKKKGGGYLYRELCGFNSYKQIWKKKKKKNKDATINNPIRVDGREKKSVD